MTGFNVQQRATIDNYRSRHKLGFVLSDEAIVELIKNVKIRLFGEENYKKFFET